MSRNARKKAEIEHRRLQVSELWLSNWTQADIARELGVSQATISGDFRAIRKQWRKQCVGNIDDVIAVEQRRLQKIAREAWAAWESSKEPVSTIRVTQKNGEKKLEKTLRHRTGDPQLLRILLDANQKHLAIMGLDKEVEAQTVKANRERDRLNWDILFEEAEASAQEPDWIEKQIAEAGKSPQKSS